jgi:hypothetical protein
LESRPFQYEGGLHQDITGPPTGLAQNLGLQKKIWRREREERRNKDEQSPYSKQINVGNSRLLRQHFLNDVHKQSFEGLGADTLKYIKNLL